MHVHVNIEGGRLPQVLPAIAETRCKLVVDHFGWSDDRLDPGGAGMEALLRHCQRGLVDRDLRIGEAEAGGQLHPALAALLIAEVGTDRLFWGSDAPFVGMEKAVTFPEVVRLFGDWVPSAEARRQIGETAHRFYFG